LALTKQRFIAVQRTMAVSAIQTEAFARFKLE
jgi:hypothetical protein